MINNVDNSSQELKGQDILEEKETTEKKWRLPEDFTIKDTETFDDKPVYQGLPAYDYNTGKRLI